MVHDDFHPFPRLPTELRLEIWRLCLPHRVSEDDDPVAFIVYTSYGYQKEIPCGLGTTSRSNTRPPLLTRVCRESREVAFATGTWYPYLAWRGAGWFAGPSEADWATGNVINFSLASRFPGPIRTPPSGQNPAALKLLPEWMVVVKVVIIHLDLRRAAHSGLFGLSGDGVIQVVDANSPLASQLYELAEDCERGASAITAAQDFTRMSANDMDAMVKRKAFEHLNDHEVGKRLRPAIMFRLCTRMCNHINAPKMEQTV